MEIIDDSKTQPSDNSKPDEEIKHLNAQYTQNEHLLKHQANELTVLNNKLSEMNALYHALFDFSSSMYITLNEEMQIKAINFQAAYFLGMEKKHFIGKYFVDLLSFEYKTTCQKVMHTLLTTKVKQVFEFEIIQVKGDRKFIQAEFIILNNHLINICFTDMTEKYQADLHCYEMKTKLFLVNNLFQRANEAIAALSDDLIFLVINESFINLFSKIFATKIHVGMSLKTILADFPHLRGKIRTACRKALLGGKKIVLVENQTVRHKNYFCYQFYFYTVLSSDQQKQELVFQIRNITDFKIEESKQQKQQAEIEKAGVTQVKVELAAALAHEISQPLTAVIAYCQGSLNKIKKENLSVEMENQISFSLEKILLQAKLAGQIIHRIKNEKSREFTLEELNLNTLIKKTLSFLHYEESFDLKIECDFMDNLPLIYIDKIQIMQVILNLARNSIEALQSSEVMQPCLIVKTEMDNGYIKVHFRDNGPGIAEKFKKRILTTYFTTKPCGTGLGLTICRSLIEAHGGELQLIDHRGKGAWFVFKLPLKRTSAG
ncbi:MAG: HAMP domain-containing histidine kinase [Tatlockia sp.]|nr:HAMP domain-containing histidine kinase [Tatlockia sp.]